MHGMFGSLSTILQPRYVAQPCTLSACCELPGGIWLLRESDPPKQLLREGRKKVSLGLPWLSLTLILHLLFGGLRASLHCLPWGPPWYLTVGRDQGVQLCDSFSVFPGSICSWALLWCKWMCPLLKFTWWNPNPPKMTVWGGGDFGRCLSHDGGALVNGITAL